MSLRRLTLLSILITITYALTLGRFFFWQVIKSPEFAKKALSQLYKLEKINPRRGKIYTSDNFPIVQNQTFYKLALYKPNFKLTLNEIITEIAGQKSDFENLNSKAITKFALDPNQKWIEFNDEFTDSQKEILNKIDGISFQTLTKRYYPEGNLASNILGKLSKNDDGSLVGFNGLESYYQKQLEGKTGYRFQAKDAQGKPLITKNGWVNPAVNGRDLFTGLNRSVQFLSEDTLKTNVEKYQADSGSISIMDSASGEIIAMAYYKSPSATDSGSPNPPISSLFEPGSIFKPLIMSMALDSHSVDTNYICAQCNRPLTIGEYTISNWNDELHPDSNLFDIIKNSDNIGMSHIIRKLGLNNFLSYYESLRLNHKTGIDLQGEAKPITKTYWPEIDFATASFGQGIAITQIQMLQAFNTIANNGILVHPHLVKATRENEKIISIDHNKTSQKVFDSGTTNTMKKILQYGVENGAVAKLKPKNMNVCAKSGTAQVAVKGSYQDDQTIASYIGFTPCDKPKFTMIVTINTPRTSPWGASTAAPVWFDLAQKILVLLND